MHSLEMYRTDGLNLREGLLERLNVDIFIDIFQLFSCDIVNFFGSWYALLVENFERWFIG